MPERRNYGYQFSNRVRFRVDEVILKGSLTEICRGKPFAVQKVSDERVLRRIFLTG